MTDRRLAVAAWESLFRAQHEVFHAFAGDFEGDELSNGEYDVLLNVVRGDEASARLRDVTARMLISQPSVSRLVDRMVGCGLVTKCPDPQDGRGTIVQATEKGIAAFRRVAAVHSRSIASRMAVLTDDELRQLLALTTKLRGGA